MARISDSCSSLVAAFPQARRNKDKMRGWKRALTLYCQRREMETGTPALRFRAGVKKSLTQKGMSLVE